MTLTEFLLARIAEGEERHGHYKVQPSDFGDLDTPDGGCVPCDVYPPGRCRVLAECAAKRRIVEEHTHPHGYGFCPVCIDWSTEEPKPADCPTLRALASVYAGHPDCREEWALT